MIQTEQTLRRSFVTLLTTQNPKNKEEKEWNEYANF